MNLTYTFSVVIPLYNSENYIRETLMSLVNQSNKDFEVIIVDDKSTDKSVQVVQKFIHENSEIAIRLFTDRPFQKFPKGVSGSRNYGISQANGQWICFLDSDDLFHPRKLEILYKQIEVLPANIRAFHHKLLEFNDGEEIIFEKIESIPVAVNYPTLDQLVTENRIATSAVILRKDLIIESGYFDTELDGVEDYYLWLHVCHFSDWYFLPMHLTSYRVRIGSLMGGRKFEHYITQNTRLVNKLNRSTLFSKIHKKKVEEYFMFNVMQYYASISIDQFGWGNFLNGLVLLISKGYFLFAFKIGKKNTKFLILRYLSKLKP